MFKSTYGTGCFALLNTGDAAGALAEPAADDDRLPARRQGDLCARRLDLRRRRGGAVAARRAAASSARRRETQPLAEAADRNQEVILVPAFVGLGAPHWDAERRGAIFGLTRDTGPAELARAALESVGFQTRDLLEAMRADWPGGGGRRAARRWRDERVGLDDAVPRRHPRRAGRPARGARDDRARRGLARGDAGGPLPRPDEFARGWRLERRFEPAMEEAEREARYAAWKRAVAATMSV